MSRKSAKRTAPVQPRPSFHCKMPMDRTLSVLHVDAVDPLGHVVEHVGAV